MCNNRLQETCFSQRRLIFADGKVFYHCQQAIWREDFTAEDFHMQCNLGEFDNTFAIDNPNVPPTTQYAKLVREYSRRNLTFDNDAINAFQGTLSFLSSQLETSCYAGLPGPLRDWALLWASPVSLVRRNTFPSYSWLGWKGEVRFPRLPGGYRYIDWMRDYSCINYGVTENEGIETPLLHVKGMCALFILGAGFSSQGQTSKNNEGIESRPSPQRCRKLLDLRGKVCGYVNLDDQASCNHFEDEVVILIMLSVAQPSDLYRFDEPEITYNAAASDEDSSHMLAQGSGSTEAQMTTVPPWKSTHPSPKAGTITTDPGWGYLSKNKDDAFNFTFYNVMLLQAPSVFANIDDDGHLSLTKLSYRQGLGILQYEALAWAIQEPWEENIVLA